MLARAKEFNFQLTLREIDSETIEISVDTKLYEKVQAAKRLVDKFDGAVSWIEMMKFNKSGGNKMKVHSEGNKTLITIVYCRREFLD